MKDQVIHGATRLIEHCVLEVLLVADTLKTLANRTEVNQLVKCSHSYMYVDCNFIWFTLRNFLAAIFIVISYGWKSAWIT